MLPQLSQSTSGSGTIIAYIVLCVLPASIRVCIYIYHSGDSCTRRERNIYIEGTRTRRARAACKMADHRGDSYYGSGGDPRAKNDDPPNSRLFVICHKSLEEDELRKAFDKFGKIEDIWVVKDRNTGENKGWFWVPKPPFCLSLSLCRGGRMIKETARCVCGISILVYVKKRKMWFFFVRRLIDNYVWFLCLFYAGVTYIKYSKTSEAAFALEEMNGKMLGSVGRPIKVMIASK